MAILDIEIYSQLRSFAVDIKLALAAEVIALVGPSGAGKTTLLRSIAGLHRPDRGEIVCRDDVWFRQRVGTRAIDLEPERRSVGYVPQHHALFPHMTVAANVAFSGADRATVAELLQRLGIAALATERPAQLSGGERQRVALARALGRRPQVLILDEPLAALDPHTRRAVRDELRDELRSLAIPTLIVTHDFADAAALADRVAVITAGTLRQLASPFELVNSPADSFVVALTGGSVIPNHDGDTQLAVYPWDVEVRPGPGPDDALKGTVRATSLEGGRVNVRVDGWVGEAQPNSTIREGDLVHGIIHNLHRLKPTK